jgi:hypothetical protein
MASGWSSVKFCESSFFTTVNKQWPAGRRYGKMPLVKVKLNNLKSWATLSIRDKVARLFRLFSNLLAQHHGATELLRIS